MFQDSRTLFADAKQNGVSLKKGYFYAVFHG
jgi:hypothetical protein